MPQSRLRPRRLDSRQPRPHSLAAFERVVAGPRQGLLGLVRRRYSRLESHFRRGRKRWRRRVLPHRARRQPPLRIRDRRALPAILPRHASSLTPLLLLVSTHTLKRPHPNPLRTPPSPP